MQGHTVDVTPFRRMFEALPHPMPPAPIDDFIKTTLDLRGYVTDAIGGVLFDSAGLDEGEDYSCGTMSISPSRAVTASALPPT